MAGSRTSYLAIRVVGESLGATKSLAAVDRALRVVEESTRQTDVQMKKLAATEAGLAKAGGAVTKSNMGIAKSAQIASVAIEDLDDAISDLDFYKAGGTGKKPKGKKGGKGAAAMLGWAAAAAAAAAISVKAFSDIQEAAGAVQAIFGESIPVAQEATLTTKALGMEVELVGTDAATSAEQMLIFAEDMNKYGVSTAQAAQASAILGAQLKNAGIPAEYLASVTQQLVKLGADMAVTFGYTVPQALTALAAALRGEYEPLEKFGYSLNAASVQAEALRLQSAGVTFETKRQAQVVATLSLIQQQSTDIQKKAQEEYMNVAMSVSRLRAETRDLAGVLGGILAPSVSIVTDETSQWIDKLTESITQSGFMTAASDLLKTAFQGIADILGPIVIPLLETLESVLARVADFINVYLIPPLQWVADKFNAIATAIGNVITKIQELITWIDELWTRPMEETAAALEAAPAVAGMARKGPGVGATGVFGSPGSSSINITVQTGIGDPVAIAREIRRVLANDQKRLGWRTSSISV